MTATTQNIGKIKIVILHHNHQNVFIKHKLFSNINLKDLCKEKRLRQLITLKMNQIIHIKLETMVPWVLQIY